MISRLPIAAALAILAGGCGAHENPTYRLTNDLAGARSESTLHRDRSLSATTVDDAMIELGRHEQVMDGLVGKMHGAVDDMSLCSSGNVGAMHAKTDEIDDMVSDHRTRMESSAFIAEVQDEARGHHASMLEMLDSMRRMAGNMSCMGDG